MIGQFDERFQIQLIHAQDILQLSVKVGRKILAHAMAFFWAGSLNFDGYSDLEKTVHCVSMPYTGLKTLLPYRNHFKK
jgi:hypothetical protein